MTIFVYAPLESDMHIYDPRLCLSLRTREQILIFLESIELYICFCLFLSLRTRAQFFNFVESIEFGENLS
mgnify:CR=1 FL=1